MLHPIFIFASVFYLPSWIWLFGAFIIAAVCLAKEFGRRGVLYLSGIRTFGFLLAFLFFAFWADRSALPTSETVLWMRWIKGYLVTEAVLWAAGFLIPEPACIGARAGKKEAGGKSI